MGRMTERITTPTSCVWEVKSLCLEALDILEAWLNTEFEGGRHCISLDMIEEAESVCSSEFGFRGSKGIEGVSKDKGIVLQQILNQSLYNAKDGRKAVVTWE